MASPSSSHQKQKVTMGYPSMDQYLFPPSSSAYPCGPHQGYPTHYAGPPPPNHPNYHFPLGYIPQTDDPTYPAHVGSHKPYHPYPNTGEFYYPQQHYKPLVLDQGMSEEGSSSFGRSMLVLMVVLVASMCMTTLVMWILFGSYIPEFEVTSMKVSNFTILSSTLTGTWEVAVSVANTNKGFDIQFDRVVSSIFYKEALLGISAVKPFKVGQRQQTEFNFSILPAEQHSEENKLQRWELPTLEEEHRNGMVVFSLRLAIKANFTTPNMLYRLEYMRVMCENMQVMFSAATGEGNLLAGMGSTCLIGVHDGLKDY